MVGMARIYHNVHWISDTFLAAMISYNVADFVVHHDKEDDEDFQDVTNLLAKGSSAKMLLQCTGLWFSSVGFGATWKGY